MKAFPRIPLANLIRERNQKRPVPTNSQVWNLNLDQIESGSGRVWEKEMTTIAELGPSTYAFEAGTVLYSKLRPYLNKVVVADCDGFATTELVPLRCDPEKVFPQYLAYYLRSEEFLTFANTVVAGAKMPRMVMSEFWRYEVPIPPMPDQRRIAAMLVKADTLRVKRREALAQLESLEQSIFMEMFGDPVTNPFGWSTYSMSDISTFENGDRSSNYPSGDDIKSEGVLFLSTKNIKKNRIDLSTTSFISESKFKSLTRGKARPNDILITLRGTLGSCCVFRCAYEKAFINAQMMIIRADETILTNYLFAVLSCKQFQEMFERIGQGAAVPQLTSKQLSEIKVAVPPLSLQHEFIKRIEAINKMKLHLQTAATSADELFKSLQQRAFLGKI